MSSPRNVRVILKAALTHAATLRRAATGISNDLDLTFVRMDHIDQPDGHSVAPRNSFDGCRTSLERAAPVGSASSGAIAVPAEARSLWRERRRLLFPSRCRNRLR